MERQSYETGVSARVRIELVQADEFPKLLGLVKDLLRELGDEASGLATIDDARLSRELAGKAAGHVAFVARTDADELVGCATVAESFAIYAGGRYGVINEMYVKPAFRSRHVGRLLIRNIKDLGMQRGWKRIDVTAPTEARWSRTVRFYEREGFVFTGPKLKCLL